MNRSNLALKLVNVALFAAVIVIHAIDLPGKLEEVPYLGFGYMGLMAGLVVAGVLLFTKAEKAGWILGLGLCAATFVGFVLTRTTGLPGATDDIGNWGEMLGILSLLTEAGVIAVSALGLRTGTRRVATLAA